jgi:hypothetical protein
MSAIAASPVEGGRPAPDALGEDEGEGDAMGKGDAGPHAVGEAATDGGGDANGLSR